MHRFLEWKLRHLQYIPRNMHTVTALLCFVVVIHWLIFPYPSGLLHWHCGNLWDDCPSASKATLMNMDKYFMWIQYERLHNHNKAKHNKTVCIFLGIYCKLNPHRPQSKPQIRFIRCVDVENLGSVSVKTNVTVIRWCFISDRLRMMYIHLRPIMN